jgi:LacI family transcriptional regulator
MAGLRKSGEVTIKHIAASLGIAHSTVSRALNDHPHINPETKAKVRRAAQELGYAANSGARMMRSGASRLVGLIVPDVQNEFYNAAAKIMADSCAREGYQLVLAVSEDDSEKELQQVQALREARVAGVLVAATASPRRDTVQMLKQLPTVQFLRRHPGIAGHTVRADDVLGIYKATEHLLGLGHRRIGYVGVTEQLSTGRARADGYRHAYGDARLKVNAGLMRLGAPRPEFGHEALVELCGLPTPPTAIVVASPRLMLGVLEGVNALRLSVPEDVSLVAYSDLDWFQVWQPALTAVALPVADMAATAALLLFRQIQQRGPEGSGSSTPFEPVLYIRGSSAPLRVALKPVKSARR